MVVDTSMAERKGNKGEENGMVLYKDTQFELQ